MVLKRITPSLFADNTGNAVAAKEIPELQDSLKAEVEALTKLSINVEKTDFIIIASKSNLAKSNTGI